MNSASYNTTPRWLSIVLGIASIIFGWLFLTNPGTTMLAIAMLLGIYFLIIGIMSIIGMFTGSPGSKLWKLIGGILAIIAGVLLLSRPIMGGIATGVTFNFLVAFFAILAGIALLIDGFRGGGCLAIILGILGIVLGTLVLFNPLAGVLALPVMMGIMAIAAGIMAILGAIFRPSPPPPPPAPVRTMSAPAVTAPKADVAKATAGVAAAGAAAAAATKAAADSTAAKTAAAVDTGAAAASDASAATAAKTAAAAKWVGETMGAEDVADFANAKLAWSEDTLEGLPDGILENLKGIGVVKPADFLQRAATPAGRAELSKATGVPESAILRWANQLDLRRVKGIGEIYATLLEASGVDTVPELAQRNAANLLNRMTAVNSEQSIANALPTLTDVEDWIRQAKELPRIITY